MQTSEAESKVTLYKIFRAQEKTSVNKAEAISGDKPAIIFLGGAKYTTQPEEKYLQAAIGTMEPFFSIFCYDLNTNIQYYSVRSNSRQIQLEKNYLEYNKSPLTYYSEEAKEIAEKFILTKTPDLREMPAEQRSLILENSKKALSNISFVSFSYGCCLVEEIGNALHKLLLERGYSKEEARDLIKCLGGISVAPVNVFIKKEFTIPQIVLLAGNDNMSRTYTNVTWDNEDIAWKSDIGKVKVGKIGAHYCIVQQEIKTCSYLFDSEDTQVRLLNMPNAHSRRLYTTTFSQHLDSKHIVDFFPSSALGEIHKDTITTLARTANEARNMEKVWDDFYIQHLQPENLEQYTAISSFFAGIAEHLADNVGKTK